MIYSKEREKRKELLKQIAPSAVSFLSAMKYPQRDDTEVYTHAKKYGPEAIATVVEVDGGAWVAFSGYHLVNRIGYLLFKPDGPRMNLKNGVCILFSPLDEFIENVQDLLVSKGYKLEDTREGEITAIDPDTERRFHIEINEI